MLKATVSGSFRRHMTAIYDAVTELTELGIEVLSPADPRVVDQIGEFLFVASDRVRSIKFVEDRHLEAIRGSDFLWLVTPDGYVGQSASMELGYAIATGTPVFSDTLPTDATLQKYVRRVRDSFDVLSQIPVRMATEPSTIRFPLDPFDAIENANRRLDGIRGMLAKSPRELDDSAMSELLKERDEIVDALAPVTHRDAAQRTRKLSDSTEKSSG